MDLTTKIAIGAIIGSILVFCIATTGLVLNTHKLIEQGYTQENITYCSDMQTKTIWIKK